MRKDLGVKAFLYPQPTLVIATYNEDGTPNAMVAAWGSVSDTNQVAIYVAASHKTMPNIKARKAFTVSMATAKHIKAIDYLGVTSGNKVPDKFAKSGRRSRERDRRRIRAGCKRQTFRGKTRAGVLRFRGPRLLRDGTPRRQRLQRRKRN